MIKLSDADLLAFTKLRTHKIRTIVTILLASLLFGALVAASLVTTGALKSIDSFRKDGLTSRYIVSIAEAPGDPLALKKLLRDPALIKEAKVRYEALVKEKTVEAKRLGIAYNQVGDQPPYTQTGNDSSTLRLNINDPNGIVHDLLAEKFSAQPTFNDTRLHILGAKYHAISFFTSQHYSIQKGSTLTVLPSTGEKFYDQSDDTVVSANNEPPVLDSSLVVSPTNITAPFMLTNNGGWKPSDNAIPIILPQNSIEQLLDLEKLPDDASAAVKLDRLKEVRKKAESLTFQACYRNSASLALIQKTIQQQKDIASHSDDKNYQKPTLLYQLPNTKTCKNPTIKSDTRTPLEKQTDENQQSFDRQFGAYTAPVSYLVSFKVVGISPAERSLPSEYSTNVGSASDVLNQLLATSGVGQTIPESLYNQMSNKSKYSDIFTYTPLYLFGNEDNKQRYIEFGSAADATKFINDEGCTMQYDNTCKPLGHPYRATLAFSNSAALDDIRGKITTWSKYVLLGVMVLAAIIMWITISRTVTDGRHETAVFRAIGFKRIDIVIVYTLYTIVLSILIAACAAVMGLVGVLVANHELAPILTAQAQYDFGGLDLTKSVNLLSIDVKQLMLLFFACLATGIISMVVPLLRNVRRSPIRDMREE